MSNSFGRLILKKKKVRNFTVVRPTVDSDILSLVKPSVRKVIKSGNYQLPVKGRLMILAGVLRSPCIQFVKTWNYIIYLL